MVLLICVRLPLIVLLAAASKRTNCRGSGTHGWGSCLVPPPGWKVITAVYLETPSDSHNTQIFKVLAATRADAIGYGSYPLGPRLSWASDCPFMRGSQKETSEGHNSGRLR